MTSIPPTMQELIRWRRIAAEAVAAHGEIYLPHFEKIQAEIEKREETQSRIRQALAFAS